ncbi:MAG TPA: hypothetical protein VGD56_05775 [Gemmatirosa sp.]
MPPSPAPLVVARPDPGLSARVEREVPLFYADGADPALDRPAYVRAGSGLARVHTPAGLRLAVVQDDANFIALVHPVSGRAECVTLPAGPDGRRLFEVGRGNKLDKMDLESCLVLPDPERAGAAMLVALGSGALAVRERIVVVRGLDARGAAGAEVRVVDASRLYALLRGIAEFAGAEMNVEGAARVGAADGAVVRLFSRGNGAAAAQTAAGAGGGSATCDIDAEAFAAYLLDPANTPVPPPTRVVRYDLGAIDGEALGFTDAMPWATPRGEGVLYTAAAERSVNAIEDGPVAGSVLGVIDADGGARWAPLVEASGARFTRKAEGVARGDAPGRVWIVLDVDDPAQPAVLCEVVLDGAWGG